MTFDCIMCSMVNLFPYCLPININLLLIWKIANAAEQEREGYYKYIQFYHSNLPLYLNLKPTAVYCFLVNELHERRIYLESFAKIGVMLLYFYAKQAFSSENDNVPGGWFIKIVLTSRLATRLSWTDYSRAAKSLTYKSLKSASWCISWNVFLRKTSFWESSNWWNL